MALAANEKELLKRRGEIEKALERALEKLGNTAYNLNDFLLHLLKAANLIFISHSEAHQAHEDPNWYYH